MKSEPSMEFRGSEPMNPKQPVPWYRRWWALALMVVIVLAVVVFGAKYYHESRIEKELARELQALEQQDPHWDFDKWQARQPALKEEENLAVQALRLPARYTGEIMGYDRLYPNTDNNPANRMSADQLAALQTLVGDVGTLPADIARILSLKTGVFPLPNLGDPKFMVMSSSSGRQQDLRGVYNLLYYYGQLQIDANQAKAALDVCEAGLLLGHASDHDPYINSHLNRIAIQTSVATLIERALAQTQPEAGQLARLQAKVQADAETSFSLAGVIGDRAYIDRFLREVGEGRYDNSDLSGYRQSMHRFRSGKGSNVSFASMMEVLQEWLGSAPYGYIPDERLKALRFYQEIIALHQKPGIASLDEVKKIVDRYRLQSRAVAYFGLAIPRIYEAEVKRRAQLRQAAGLLAAERYRLEQGKAPTGWSDLVPKYLPEVPVDPYDGQPMRWKATPTGFVVYSVSSDKKDDGGVVRRTPSGAVVTDLGLEYFAPAFRRAAPIVVAKADDLAQIKDAKELFFAAARAGRADKIKQLLDGGFDVNTKTEYGTSALCYAAESGHLEVIKLLIERKIDLDAKDTFYQADALNWALMQNQHEAVGLLLKAGAKGEAGALSLAISQNKPKMVAAILGSGRIKQEALDAALKGVDAKQTEMVKLLTEAGAKGKPKETVAEAKKTEAPAGKTEKTEEPAAPTVAAAEPTERVQTAQPWNGFRGHNNAGVADGQYPPTSWDATTGKHLAWKTPIPGLGLSCPVVWGNRLFVTTAVNAETPKPSLRIGQYGDVDSVKETAPHTWITYCLDTQTGKILWQQKAHTGVPKVKRHMKSSHANATVVTNGKHVVVNFGSEGLYCYSMQGAYLWKYDLGKLGSAWFFNPDYEWGFGSSPAIFEDSVIVQCDVGKNSFIAAYSLEDGNELWSTPRDEIPSWCSPTVIYPEKGPPELVTVATKYARGYDPLTGKELWKLGKFSEIAVPTPFYAKGLLYLTTGYRPIQPIYAMKLGARGDISLEKGKEANDFIVWSKSRGGPYLPTPLVYGDHLYVCNNAGVLSCYEAKTGKMIYQKRLGGKSGYTASLVAADGRIYCTDEEGVVRVVKAGPEFQLLAINKLGEECLCHPAISNGRIYFRGREHVFAFMVPREKQ